MPSDGYGRQAPLPARPPTTSTASTTSTAPADQVAPRRSRVGLAAQFVLQFLYIPLGFLLVLGFAVLLLWASSDAGGGTPVSGGGGPGGALGGVAATGISWRRLRIEWNGRPEEWEPFTEALLVSRFDSARKSSGWAPFELPPGGVRRAVTGLSRRDYRGLAPTEVEQLARRHGWSVDWEKSRLAEGDLHFFRLIPPPRHHGVPDLSGPPPAAGTPWGPMRARILLPLLTLPFLPRVRFLELRRSPEAYVRHLRRYLTRRLRAELTRERKADVYRSDPAGPFLRRVRVHPRHFRGAGAAALLRVAAEQGWKLDHSYPADPQGTVHLCFPDESHAPLIRAGKPL
ncbi:hypothetical protein [Kitasatospora sp. NPDC101183]|uniref:hypothetical protein n=1 Tax=Kitasatospora sp. NPDC101183 TaxID=3364100 RepID=UPI003802C4D5